MMDIKEIYATIPVTDLARAKEFYSNILGLTVSFEDGYGIMFAVNGCELYVYTRESSNAAHTLAAFQVEDIEKAVTDLMQKGVTFEHYDSPEIKTDEKGIATTPPVKAAWFKDPDGNFLGITQTI
jgi:catechol 2,3-dioxygenase-like lactoylglutathione lyase family enzyme